MKHPAIILFLIAIIAIPEAHAAPPVANAGPDITVADYDGNNSVTVRLNGSASADIDGDIVSWQWTWPGGSASGVTPEVVFPATNSPVTVTLTVTDATSLSSMATVIVAAYQKETALFTDFKKPSYRDIGAGLEGYIAGNLLVIDTGPDEVYRRNGASWVQESFPVLGGNQFKVDANTVVTLSPAFGGTPSVIRYAANAWTPATVAFSPTDTILDGFNNQRVIAMDPQTVVIADYGSDHSATDGGRARVYHWSGDTWAYQTDLTPQGGFVANGAFGKQVEVRGDGIVVSGYNPVSGSSEFHVFRRSSGVWAHEITFDGKRSVSDPVGVFNWGFGFGNNVLAATRAVAGNYELAIYEKLVSGWNQRILGTGDGAIAFEFVEVDSDGDAIAGSAFSGADCLFKRPGADWQAGVIPSQLLLTTDNPSLRISDFSDNLLTMRDGVAGVIRLIDTTTNVFPINVEPIADAGLDIQTTSFDGQPVQVFLNAGASIDIDGTIDAVWTWPGGSATGLYAFAMIPPDVTSIVLKVTDNLGAISTDSIAVNIVRPPVIEAGIDRVVVDSDGNGSAFLNVSAQVISTDHPIASYSWSWPGGVFSGQSGTITLGAAADGKDVTLTVVDQAGLVSQSSFRFNLLNPQPVPDIIAPANAQNNDQFGWSVAINGSSAMVGALNKPATYQLENINGVWQQISLSPGAQQGSAVALANDFAFSGAYQESSGVGRVRSLVKTGGVWGLSSLLAPPPNNTEGVYPFNSGMTLARHGDRLIVGAPRSSIYDGVTSANFCGAAFVYRLVNGSWVLEQTLKSLSPESDGGFGAAVAIHGQTIAVGSNKNDEVYNSGLVEVFELGTVWTHVATLENAPGASGLDEFGRSLAMNGTEILAGAPGEGNGQVYRFRKNGGGIWQSNGVILPVIPPSPNLSIFGSSLSLKDDVLVVGVPGDYTGTNRGGVQTFLLDNNVWQHRGSLAITTQLDPSSGSNFIQFASGHSSISHDGRNLIVGAKQARTVSGVQSGKAYIFRNYAALDPDANYEPRAEAGAPISVTDTVVRGPAPDYLITEPPGSELVTLNASASTDQENAIASYAWTWPGGSAMGVTAQVRFPVGTTVVTLTVTDDEGIVNTDTVNVTVALAQTPPAALAGSGNTLTVNLPVPGAKWRLSSEFMWHASGESADDVVLNQSYQLEIIGFPGSTETVTTFVTPDASNFVANLTLILPLQPVTSGTVSFPETSQGFAWRLRGETAWRNVLDDGDAFDELIGATVATGELIIDYKPVTGYATPASQLVNIQSGQPLVLNWNDYQRIDNFDPAKTFTAAVSPNLGGDPYQYIGMIRTPLGRGTGTVVAERVVLTAAHLFFDSTGLQWADTQWFPRHQQETRQAPPVTPRGILYQTAYAQIVAPDSVQNPVATVPADKKEADFAVLFFSGSGTWEGGSANYLQSTAARNWLTGTENKQAAGYAQRSQPYEQRGKIFGKSFATALSPVDNKPLPLIYETGELFGDGGASGSALFVQPQGTSGFYPAAILLAGQDRAVYRVIDQDVGRMIQDAQDAASGNDEVLNNNFSLVTYGGSGLRALQVGIVTPEVLSTARWTVKPNVGTTYSNLTPTQRVGYSSTWGSVTVSFTAVPGFITPPAITLLSSQVPPNGVTTIGNIVYEAVSGFDLWKQSNGITEDGDDRDGDGKNALAEYAINGNINSGSDPAPIRMAAAPLQNINAEFEVYVSTTADKIRYTVKASNTLSRAGAATLVTFTKADGINGYVRVTDIQPKSASSKRFAWVEYTHDRNLPATP
jgi:hypothetical protein